VSGVPDHADRDDHDDRDDRLDAEFQIDRDPAQQRPGEADEARAKRAAAERIRQQHTWVDLQVRQAMERGDFDRLPGYGKPIEGLGAEHDPEWWLKGLIERERIAVLPASLQLRKDDAELDERLDALYSEAEVRREVEEFNARVIRARYRPPEGPPLITMPRDVDETLAAWRARRTARAEARRAALAARAADAPPEPAFPGLRGWWRRRTGR
jgi:hypothetical protein